MKNLSWDEYFMVLAKASALRSKDPNTKVGAVLVNERKRIIGLGYNGMPNGNDQDFPWERNDEDATKTKYSYVVHAEMNAILNSTNSLDQATLFVSLFPCSNCAKFIAQSGIKEIVYEDDKYENTIDDQISKNIFQKTNIKFRKIEKVDLKIKDFQM